MIHQGDALEVLRTMADESVQCCVTSPPYWGLRSYGTAPLVFGGDPACAHEWGDSIIAKAASYKEGSKARWNHRENGRGEEQAHMVDRAGWERKAVPQGNFCRCGAWRGDLGLEPTPELFVAHLVEIFREVRRVLKPDGVLFCNMGDSYATGAGKVKDHPGGGKQGAAWAGRGDRPGSPKHTEGAMGPMTQPNRMPIPGLKPKDLVGVPWMLAFALRADGWWLRQDIIWHKPAPMPESVLDRCTKAHEYIFLLTKSERYYWDAKAISEPATFTGPNGRQLSPYAQGFARRSKEEEVKRQMARSGNKTRKPASARGVPVDTNGQSNGAVAGSIPWEGNTRNKRSVWTINPRPFAEAHFATFPEEIPIICMLAGSRPGDLVLDPFSGAGTVGVVADKLQRRYVGIELNPAYVAMAERRIRNVAPLFSEAAS